MPDNAYANALYGNALALAGDDKAALTHLKKADRLKPHDEWITSRIDAVQRRLANESKP